MRSLFATIFVLSFVNYASAYVADGHEYSLICNSSGFVLNSKGVVTRFVEAGAGSKVVRLRERLFLGKNCDAFHELFGGGKWCWANGGFGAEFTGKRFWFPRQELICKSDNDNHLGCNC